MYVVLDTETTGRSFYKGDRLIEIGAVKYEGSKQVGEYHAYIQPDCAVSIGALKVHGLSDQFLSDKPGFAEIAQSFLEFVETAPLVIHNAPFDIGFLDNELAEFGFEKLTGRNEIIDTLPMARKMYPGQRNSLDALCKRLGIDASMRVKHGALLDAKLLAEVYLQMTSKQNTMSIQSKAGIAQVYTVERSGKNFYQGPSDSDLALHNKYFDDI